MQIDIPYGSGTLAATLPPGSATLTTKEPAARMTEELFARDLRNQLRKRPLDLRDTMIVIADKTRLCGYARYLPVLASVLMEFGLGEGGLRFIIGYGTHPRQSDEECLACYGGIYRQHPFIHHDCTAREAFAEYGVTTRGVPVRLRRDIMAATCVITMGPICHHYFAGYGGGRKLIFPGCGEREAIYANHSLYLDKDNRRLAPGCRPGVLEGNPLADDLFDIAAHKEADLAIHGIMNSHGQVCDFLIGTERTTYLEACAVHGRLCESSSPASPLVIASCGGYPKDINFIQSHKAIHNGAMFVADGGTLLIFSECRDGIGSQTFLPWFEMGGFEEAFDHLQENYQGNGGTALAMMAKTRRIRIILVTALDEGVCRSIGVETWNRERALAFIDGLEAPAAYIGNASLLVRKTV